MAGQPPTESSDPPSGGLVLHGLTGKHSSLSTTYRSTGSQSDFQPSQQDPTSPPSSPGNSITTEAVKKDTRDLGDLNERYQVPNVRDNARDIFIAKLTCLATQFTHARTDASRSMPPPPPRAPRSAVPRSLAGENSPLSSIAEATARPVPQPLGFRSTTNRRGVVRKYTSDINSSLPYTPTPSAPSQQSPNTIGATPAVDDLELSSQPVRALGVNYRRHGEKHQHKSRRDGDVGKTPILLSDNSPSSSEVSEDDTPPVVQPTMRRTSHPRLAKQPATLKSQANNSPFSSEDNTPPVVQPTMRRISYPRRAKRPALPEKQAKDAEVRHLSPQVVIRPELSKEAMASYQNITPKDSFQQTRALAPTKVQRATRIAAPTYFQLSNASNLSSINRSISQTPSKRQPPLGVADDSGLPRKRRYVQTRRNTTTSPLRPVSRSGDGSPNVEDAVPSAKTRKLPRRSTESDSDGMDALRPVSRSGDGSPNVKDAVPSAKTRKLPRRSTKSDSDGMDALRPGSRSGDGSPNVEDAVPSAKTRKLPRRSTESDSDDTDALRSVSRSDEDFPIDEGFPSVKDAAPSGKTRQLRRRSTESDSDDTDALRSVSRSDEDSWKAHRADFLRQMSDPLSPVRAVPTIQRIPTKRYHPEDPSRKLSSKRVNSTTQQSIPQSTQVVAQTPYARSRSSPASKTSPTLSLAGYNKTSSPEANLREPATRAQIQVQNSDPEMATPPEAPRTALRIPQTPLANSRPIPTTSSDEFDPDASLPLNFDPFQLGVHLQTQLAIRYGSQTAQEANDMPDALTKQLNPLGTQSREEHRRIYNLERSKGICSFLEFLYKEELACNTLRDADRDLTLEQAYMTFICFDSCIITGLINGDLATKLVDESSAEYAIQKKLRQRAEDVKHCAFYMNAITDEDGKSPSKKDIQGALGIFQQYCFEDSKTSLALANRMDNAYYLDTKPTPKNFRKYLWDQERTHLVQCRLSIARTFVENVQRKLDHLDSAEIADFLDIFVEFGFTSNVNDRFYHHSVGIGSNYVMQIFFLSLKEYMQGGTQQLRQYVVGLCAAPEHAALGEIIVTRLGQGYVTSGTGFSHYPAGRSVNPSRRPSAWANDWVWCENNSAMLTTHAEEIQRIKKTMDADEERQREAQRNQAQKGEVVVRGLMGLLPLLLLEETGAIKLTGLHE